MATRMLQRRGTAAEWAAQNPVLGPGEIGFETDTKIIRVGDGVTAWNSLTVPYISAGGGTMIGALTLIAPTLPDHAARLSDISAGIANVSLREMLVLTANVAFIKANYPWMKSLRVRAVGGGGGGGGAGATTSTQAAVASSGAGGHYAESSLLASVLAASVAVVVGVGGSAGAAGVTNGGNGGDSSFGSHVIAAGGAAGGSGAAATGTTVLFRESHTSPVYTGSVGQIVIPGSGAGIRWFNSERAIPSEPGKSILSTPAQGSLGSSVGQGPLSAPPGYGSGGYGAVNAGGQTNRAGGVGGPGVVILELYG